MKTDDEKSVTLSSSSSSSPCFIYIDAKRLSNYTIVGVEVMSSSRNIELYSGISDTTCYVSTGRGTLVNKVKGRYDEYFIYILFINIYIPSQ